MNNRKEFLARLLKMAAPVLDAASQGKLRQTMTVEQKPGASREPFAGLEAVARLLNGMSAWLESDITDPEEKELRDHFAEKARLAITFQVDPYADDFADYTTYHGPFCQILVDAALLSQGILRAPTTLLDPLSKSSKVNLEKLLKATQNMPPVLSNWLLFSTEVELLLRKITGSCHEHLITQYLNCVNSWYFGDGWYGDGPHFATDYYNSLIIHPMILDIDDSSTFLKRAQRHAEVLENLIAPDGTYIATGRSLAYRCGVFHLLSMLCWQRRLPDSIHPSTARDILYAVTEKTLSPANYRPDGFLNIGICNHDPDQGQGYICTGSLYMASAAFLILGIPAQDDFWTLPSIPWTQKRIWAC